MYQKSPTKSDTTITNPEADGDNELVLSYSESMGEKKAIFRENVT